MEEPEHETGDLQRRAASVYELSIGGGKFDMSELQSFSLFYANSSAYIGQIKYQSYSEPLIVSGARGRTDTITFQSIHSSPTGWQQMYVVPRQSRPVGFSTPHGSPPAGVRVGEFGFARNGGLENRGLNLFYFCRQPFGELAKTHTYQLYWLAGGIPRNLTCRGPAYIHATDGCSRSF
jgi:hypothetical protein